MVECEYLIHDKDSNIFAVLIDTWWNVNETHRIFFLNCYLVLIDTWWNVNRITAKKKRARTYVLIDTWWNVNMPVNAITDNRYRF